MRKCEWLPLLLALLLLCALAACGPNGEIGGRNSSDSADSVTAGNAGGGPCSNWDNVTGNCTINTTGAAEISIAITEAPGGSAGIVTFTGAPAAECTATCDAGAVTATVNQSGESLDICPGNSVPHDMTCTATVGAVTVTDTITLAH